MSTPSGSSDSYLITNFVIEVRKTGLDWITWGAVDPGRIPDEETARKAFVTALATRHDPAKLQFRLVRRTAMITDEVLDEEPATPVAPPWATWPDTR